MQEIKTVRDLPLRLNVYKSMGSKNTYPKALEELADMVAKSLSIIFDEKDHSHYYEKEKKEGGLGELQTGESHLCV